MRRSAFATLTGLTASALLAVGMALPTAQAKDLPGTGKTVKPARATWDTGWFQTEIYIKAIEKLGYNVQPPVTLGNPAFYQAVGQGDVDFWVNGWFPLHNTYKKNFQPGAETIGYVAKGGALQGYLIDKKTAEKYHITNLSDFKNKKIDKLFDTNGDGKANLVACPPGWGCELVIKHQLDAYGLRPYIEPIKASYSASMADAIGRYREGKPIFFYTWTPNWTVGMLKPGKDVVWLEVPYPSLPKDQKNLEKYTSLKNVKGCAGGHNPCKLGWPANDIRPVANKAFLKKNPAIKKLFEEMRIPIKAIYAQNAQMNAGADKPKDISHQADQWIAAHQKEFNRWIKQAEAAAD